MINYIKERLFGIKKKNKSKNSFLEITPSLTTIIPSTYIDGKKTKNVIWDDKHFKNKIYLD